MRSTTSIKFHAVARIVIVLFLGFTPTLSFAQDWKWTGFEVIGNRTVTKADILSLLPVKVGDVYKEDPSSWKKWCSDIKKQFKFHYTECSAVRYLNFEAYVVIEIVEVGYEYRSKFRADPTGDITLASSEVLDLYERLYKRLWELFNQGIAAQETTDKGYLDYSDKQMHNIVEQLVKVTPKYRDNLLEVLEKDKDINKREKAANLLNWTVNSLDDSIVRANRLLDDPSGLVRNNISRFTLHFVDKVQTEKYRHGLIDQLLLQLDRPSHGDRNKAIYNLLSLAHTFPSDRPYIKTNGLSVIEYTSQTSVLSNVRDPATELLKLLNDGTAK